jgi:hypothetical protein
LPCTITVLTSSPVGVVRTDLKLRRPVTSSTDLAVDQDHQDEQIVVGVDTHAGCTSRR